MTLFSSVQFSSVQSLSHVQLFATPWTAVHQASLFITSSRNLFKLMSIESMMPSNHLIPVVPFSFGLQSFPASESFLMSQFFASGPQTVEFQLQISHSNQYSGWFPLGLTGLISLQSKGLSAETFRISEFVETILIGLKISDIPDML